jgi:hypothetical protein
VKLSIRALSRESLNIIRHDNRKIRMKKAGYFARFEYLLLSTSLQSPYFFLKILTSDEADIGRTIESPDTYAHLGIYSVRLILSQRKNLLPLFTYPILSTFLPFFASTARRPFLSNLTWPLPEYTLRNRLAISALARRASASVLHLWGIPSLT